MKTVRSAPPCRENGSSHGARWSPLYAQHLREKLHWELLLEMYHAKVEVASVDEVYEAPWRANRHIHPAAQLTDLLPNVHSTIVAAHNQTRRGFLELALHLLCQLARGRQDDAAGGLPTPWEAFCVLLQAPGGVIRASSQSSV